MGQFIIEASNIRKKYDDKTVLKDISLQAQRGEAVGLVGVNGCGKSTLLRILAGLSNPSSGEVSLQAGTRMAFIPDRYEKINMTLGKFMEHIYLMETEREGRDRMAHYLHQFHLETMLKTPMKYLSKGTLQKAAVIQALLGKRDLMFLDEPLSGQDTLSQMTLIQELRERKEKGMALIMACHETYLIEELADRIYEIKEGELADGIPYVYGTHRKQCSLLFQPCSRPGIMEILKQCLPEEGWNITDFGTICRIEADTALADKLFGICLEKQWHIVRYEEADET